MVVMKGFSAAPIERASFAKRVSQPVVMAQSSMIGRRKGAVQVRRHQMVAHPVVGLAYRLEAFRRGQVALQTVAQRVVAGLLLGGFLGGQLQIWPGWLVGGLFHCRPAIRFVRHHRAGFLVLFVFSSLICD